MNGNTTSKARRHDVTNDTRLENSLTQGTIVVFAKLEALDEVLGLEYRK